MRSCEGNQWKLKLKTIGKALERGANVFRRYVDTVRARYNRAQMRMSVNEGEQRNKGK